MFQKKQKSVLLLLSVIEVILSILCIMILTLIFRFETTEIRYLFLLGDLYVIYSFSKTLSGLETKIEKNFVKSSQYKTESKCIKKMSV